MSAAGFATLAIVVIASVAAFVLAFVAIGYVATRQWPAASLAIFIAVVSLWIGYEASNVGIFLGHWSNVVTRVAEKD